MYRQPSSLWWEVSWILHFNVRYSRYFIVRRIPPFYWISYSRFKLTKGGLSHLNSSLDFIYFSNLESFFYSHHWDICFMFDDNLKHSTHFDGSSLNIQSDCLAQSSQAFSLSISVSNGWMSFIFCWYLICFIFQSSLNFLAAFLFSFNSSSILFYAEVFYWSSCYPPWGPGLAIPRDLLIISSYNFLQIS